MSIVLLACTVAMAQKKETADLPGIQYSLNKASQYIKKSLYDSATPLLHQALAQSQRNNFKKGEATSYDLLAEIMLATGKRKEFEKYDSLGMPIAAQLKDTSLLISFHNRAGVYYMETGKNKEAEHSFNTALAFGLEKQGSQKTAEVNSNLGSLFLALGEKDKAIDGFFKALRLYEKNNSEVGMGETYSNISSVYYLMGKVDDAINYQKISIGIREKLNDRAGLAITNINIGQLYILKELYPLALQHLQNAVKYAEQLNNAKLMASAYSGMSAYASRTKDFPTALSWQTKAIKLFEETGNKQMLSRLYVSAGNLAKATKDSLTAIGFYDKALGISKEMGNKENIANAYEKLSSFYVDSKNYEQAHDFYKKYILYRDSITARSALAKVEEIRTLYETEKKDNEISRLSTDQRIKALQIEKQNALIAGNTLEAQKKENEIELLSKSQELQEAKIMQQDEQLEKQLLLAKTNEQQLQLAEKEKQLQQKQLKNSALLRNFILAGVVLLLLLGYFMFSRYQLKRKIQEQEALLSVRNNIAKDLHDEIGSTLTSIKILSEVSEKNLHKDQTKTSSFLHKITEQSAAVQQGISDIVWSVNPENDKLENMVIRMREYVAQTLESRSIHTVINIDEHLLGKTLDMNQRRDFFLIFKEAVNNIAKYADATEVQVKLERKSNDLKMQVTDNGKGFEVSRQTSSSGLKNMKARAVSLKGTLDIQSENGQGSSVTLIIPAT